MILILGLIPLGETFLLTCETLTFLWLKIPSQAWTIYLSGSGALAPSISRSEERRVGKECRL